MLQWLEQWVGGIYHDSELGASKAYEFFTTLSAVYSGIAFIVWLLGSETLIAMTTMFFIAGTAANISAICARRRWQYHRVVNALTEQEVQPYVKYTNGTVSMWSNGQITSP